MKLLIVAATGFEIEPLLNSLIFQKEIKPNLKCYVFKHLQVEILITGVGMVATAFELGKVMSSKYDFALNLGIAGSFANKFNIGDVIEINQDHFIELGAENDQDFISIFELGFLNPNVFPFSDGFIKNSLTSTNPFLQQIKKAKGITVNKVHGNEKSIKKTIASYDPEIESMEGAAFLYACLLEKLPCAQIRAISNLVEKRNRDNWNIPLAIEKLNISALKILENF